MKSQEQVVFEATLNDWCDMTVEIWELTGEIPPGNPIDGTSLWWKLKEVPLGKEIIFMPTALHEAKPDALIFGTDGELECFAYTINGKEVTR